MESPKELTALLIDDEPNITSLVSRVLHMHGYKTEIATTTEEGIRKLRKDPSIYDLVITDLNQIPTGADVVRAVQSSSNPNTPVYIISGGADPQLEQEAIELIGGERYLKKPFENISTTFRNVIDEVRQQKYGRQSNPQL